MILGAAGAMKVGFATHGTAVTYDQLATPYQSGHGAAPAGEEISYYGSGNGSNMANNACLLYPGNACSGIGTSPVTFTASTAVASMTPGNLFPFYMGSSQLYANNYQVWAGACEQEQPLQPPTVGGVPTDFASITPGKGATPLATPSVDATVFEPAIDVAVKSNGTLVLPAHVTVIFSGLNSAGTATTCQDTWHWIPMVGQETVGGVTYGIYPAPFASQAAQGSATASNTGDTGTIKVCADYNGYSETSPAIQNIGFTSPTSLTSPTVVKNSSNQIMDVVRDASHVHAGCP
jgi:hypothetical protein